MYGKVLGKAKLQINYLKIRDKILRTSNVRGCVYDGLL